MTMQIFSFTIFLFKYNNLQDKLAGAELCQPTVKLEVVVEVVVDFGDEACHY